MIGQSYRLNEKLDAALARCGGLGVVYPNNGHASAGDFRRSPLYVGSQWRIYCGGLGDNECAEIAHDFGCLYYVSDAVEPVEVNEYKFSAESVREVSKRIAMDENSLAPASSIVLPMFGKIGDIVLQSCVANWLRSTGFSPICWAIPRYVPLMKYCGVKGNIILAHNDADAVWHETTIARMRRDFPGRQCCNLQPGAQENIDEFWSESLCWFDWALNIIRRQTYALGVSIATEDWRRFLPVHTGEKIFGRILIPDCQSRRTPPLERVIAKAKELGARIASHEIDYGPDSIHLESLDQLLMVQMGAERVYSFSSGPCWTACLTDCEQTVWWDDDDKPFREAHRILCPNAEHLKTSDF